METSAYALEINRLKAAKSVAERELSEALKERDAIRNETSLQRACVSSLRSESEALKKEIASLENSAAAARSSEESARGAFSESSAKAREEIGRLDARIAVKRAELLDFLDLSAKLEAKKAEFDEKTASLASLASAITEKSDDIGKLRIEETALRSRMETESARARAESERLERLKSELDRRESDLNFRERRYSEIRKGK